MKVLKSPIIKKAFYKILELHKMKSDTCFVSLCTSTRPYSKSLKWKTFKNKLKDIDLIVCSNGGIIPLEFENCYPYLTYDAHGEKKYDKIYVKITYARLRIFFEKFPYKNIIFNFRPNLRNRICALKLKQTLKSNIYIYPSVKNYNLAKKNKFKPYNNYNPDLAFEVMNELDEILKMVKK